MLSNDSEFKAMIDIIIFAVFMFLVIYFIVFWGVKW